MAKWNRKQQENEVTDYLFSGQCFMTSGVNEAIPMEEIVTILQDLKKYVTEKNGIDYLQVYESDDGRKVWIIDQLSKDMISSGNFEPSHNHFTILLPNEY